MSNKTQLQTHNTKYTFLIELLRDNVKKHTTKV